MVKLFRRHGGACHWCRRPLRQQVQRGGKLPDDYPTIDHLRDRFHPGRTEQPARGEQRYVLSCPPCNHERGVRSQSTIPLTELHRRSGKAGLAQW